MASRDQFDEDFDFIGTEVVERAKDKEGIEPKKPKTAGFKSQDLSGEYQTNFRSVYIEVHDYASFAEFHTELPYSIKNLFTLRLFRGDIIKLRQNLYQYETDEVVHFQPLESKGIADYVERVLEYLKEVYNTPLLQDQDFMKVANPIKKVDERTIQVANSVLKYPNGSSAPMSITHLLRSANLDVRDISYIGNDSSHPYKYECTIGAGYYEDIYSTYPEVEVVDFVELFLSTKQLYCANCESHTVIKPNLTGDTKYICTDCQTQYTLEDISPEEIFATTEATEFVETINAKLQSVTQKRASERAEQFNSIIHADSELIQPSLDKAVIFNFGVDNQIIAHIFSGCVYLKIPVSNTDYTAEMPISFHHHRCTLCGTGRLKQYVFESSEADINPVISTNPFLTNNKITSTLHPVCQDCLDELLDDVESILEDNFSQERILAYKI